MKWRFRPTHPGTAIVLRVAAAAVAIRLAVLAVGFLATATIEAPVAEQRQPAETALRELPIRWDAGWYISIASRGYTYRGTGEIRQHNVAFFPAYPLALGTVARVLRVPRAPAAWGWIGVLLSTVAFAVASAFVYRLSETHGADVAATTVALVSAYPFALFFGGVYTESFFLLGCAAALWSASQGQPWRTFLWGLFVGLVRPNGLLLAIPLVAMSWLDRRNPSEPRARLAWLSAAGPVVGHGLYAAYLWSLSGDPLLWVSAQRGWGRAYLGLTGAATDVATSVMALGISGFVAQRPYDALNALAGLLALSLVIPILRRFGTAMALFVAVNLVPPIMLGGLTSLGRFTSVLFPLHMWLASVTPPAWRPALIAVMAVLQGLLAVLHYTSRPIH